MGSWRVRVRGGEERVVRSLAGAALVGLVACASSGEAEPEAKPEAAGTLRLELPVAVAVTLDGEELGHTPLRDVDVEPGEHVVGLAAPCGEAAEVTVLAESGKRSVVKDVPGVGVARLEVGVRAHVGEVHDVTVAFGERVVPYAPHLDVPACTMRVRVSDDWWGGYVEDIAFADGKTEVRDVVLAPGPDMVRFQGGPFTLGPPDGRPEDELRWVYWPKEQRPKVDLEPYDLDKTPVTAGQFWACQAARACDEGHPGEEAYPPGTRCQLEHIRGRPMKDMWYEVRSGRHNRPMNCVDVWEAEQYCKWAGKRLPTNAEWEYAARSGKESYVYPWGTQDIPEPKTIEARNEAAMRRSLDVCPDPREESDQGLCNFVEMFWKEMVSSELPVDTMRGPASYDVRGNPVSHALQVLTTDHESSYRRDYARGFRCARSVVSTRPTP